MKESRVNKYKQYRDSISKEDSKSFLTPSKTEEVSQETRLFLKLRKKQQVENIALIATCGIIAILMIVFGFILF